MTFRPSGPLFSVSLGSVWGSTRCLTRRYAATPGAVCGTPDAAPQRRILHALQDGPVEVHRARSLRGRVRRAGYSRPLYAPLRFT
jgi:hypothetical protein